MVEPRKLSYPGRPNAVTLDAAGTLLHLAEPLGRTYARAARAHGHIAEDEHVGRRTRTAMREVASLRAQDPGWRAYWAEVVRRAIGADDAAVFEDLYAHFEQPSAWCLAPGTRACLLRLREAGIRLGVVSNWDTRLVALLVRMDLEGSFDAVVASGEVGVEKPDPRIFEIACERLGVPPRETLHVGDDRDVDVDGARGAGCRALWYGHEVRDYAALCEVVMSADVASSPRA